MTAPICPLLTATGVAVPRPPCPGADLWIVCARRIVGRGVVKLRVWDFTGELAEMRAGEWLAELAQDKRVFGAWLAKVTLPEIV